MTSNVGAKLITDKTGGLGFSGNENSVMNYENIKEKVMGELKKCFKPEFINRVDDIIVFHQLTQENIEEIAKRMLFNLKKRVKELGVEIEFEDDVVKKISKAGFDPIYGARPLRRAIRSQIEDLLSEKMLDSSIVSGNKYVCKVVDDSFEFEKSL